MPSMLHAQHMESCDQLLESYDKEIMDVFNEVRREEVNVAVVSKRHLCEMFDSGQTFDSPIVFFDPR